jgi:hypothetical protein
MIPMQPDSPLYLSEAGVTAAAKELHRRQKVDANWGLWSKLTADDKAAFYDDVLAVVKVLEQFSEVWCALETGQMRGDSPASDEERPS